MPDPMTSPYDRVEVITSVQRAAGAGAPRRRSGSSKRRTCPATASPSSPAGTGSPATSRARRRSRTGRREVVVVDFDVGGIVRSGSRERAGSGHRGHRLLKTLFGTGGGVPSPAFINSSAAKPHRSASGDKG